MQALTLLSVVLFSVSLCACSSVTSQRGSQSKADEFSAQLVGDSDRIINRTGAAELQQLRLVATNLVSILVQVPELKPGSTTFQVGHPRNVFGHAVVKALEDAGFGLQLVSADQGNAYVSYGKRSSDTDVGLITDYFVAVNDLQLSREYRMEKNNIFPASLLKVTGTRFVSQLIIDDSIFKEQGGVNDAFVSGLINLDSPTNDSVINEVRVNDYDELSDAQKTSQSKVLAKARQHFFEADTSRYVPKLSKYSKYRRSVLVFENKLLHVMGGANKEAVRLMVREFQPSDLYVIKACTDVDGKNELAKERAVRVEEELLSHGVPAKSAYIAPCARASYRHASDDSPAPVELIHYRRAAS